MVAVTVSIETGIHSNQKWHIDRGAKSRQRKCMSYWYGWRRARRMIESDPTWNPLQIRSIETRANIYIYIYLERERERRWNGWIEQEMRCTLYRTNNQPEWAWTWRKSAKSRAVGGKLSSVVIYIRSRRSRFDSKAPTSRDSFQYSTHPLERNRERLNLFPTNPPPDVFVLASLTHERK